MGSSPNHSLTAGLKPWQRVSFKLTAGVGAALLVLTLVATYVGSRQLETNAVDRVRQAGVWFSDTVKRATRYSMLRDQRDNVHQIINTIGQQPGVESIRVFNKQGRIMFSSRPAEIGAMVDLQAEACYGCHYRDRPLERLPRSQRSRIFTAKAANPDAAHRVLGVINPIYTERVCSTDPCHVHTPGQKVLGVLDVGISLAEVDRELAASVRQVGWFALLAFLVVGSILGLISFFFLSRPLAGMVAATRRITAGDYDHPLRYYANDEIGALATDFERMRLSVKEKTEDLEESRRRFQTLFEQVPCYISVQDSSFRLVASNQMFQRDFGAGIGQFCYQVYKGRQDRCPNCAVEKTFSDGQVHTAEETVLSADGSPHYFLNLTAPITDRSGEILAVMEMATDVTDLRRLEDELRISEEKYRLFFNNDPNAIFVCDWATLEILDANERATGEYGWAHRDLVGRRLLELSDPADQARVSRFLAEGETLLTRVHQIKRDGQVVMVNMRAAYGEHMGRRAVIVATADITETLKTEEQLVQAAKMATLGEMSAGVAHELNQPLSVLATAGRVLAKQAGRGAPADDQVLSQVAQEMVEQVQRCSRIIDHLRQFGRKSEVERSKVNLAQPIDSVFQLLGQQLRVHAVEAVLDLPLDLPPVWAQANRLEQVFINLVINARDAIEERRETMPDLQGRIEIRAWHDGDRVVVEVADNGSGIPQALRARIFEPFFTTKEVGKGTGLGLSISFGIIRDYGGDIAVSSTPGAGTTFRITLPVAEEAES